MEAIKLNFITDEDKKRLINESIKFFDINLNTFGNFEIFIRGIPDTEDKWIRKKSKLILVYLMLNPTIRFTKDKIVDMFLPESTLKTADNIFHQMITNIRNAVNPYDNSGKSKEKGKTKGISVKLFSGFVIYEEKILHLNDDYIYKIDALVFDNFYHQMKSSESDNETKIEAAEKAVELYKGEFLPGVYETWAEDLREIYQNKFISVCEFLTETYNKGKNYLESINYSEKLLQADKLNEKVYINIIECYILLGNSSLAQNKYKQMLEIYEKEYGEKPSKKILEKINSILQ